MPALSPRDETIIGAAIARVVTRHVLVRPKDGTPHLPSYYQPEAARSLLAELEREGMSVVLPEAISR